MKHGLNGENIPIETQVPMEESEINYLLENFFKSSSRFQSREFITLLQLGFDTLSFVGTLYTPSSDEKDKKMEHIAIGLSTLVNVGTFLGSRYCSKKDREIVDENLKNSHLLKKNFLQNEPMSEADKKDVEKEMETYLSASAKANTNIIRKKECFNIISNISLSFATGIIAYQSLRKENKIDAKSISALVFRLSQSRFLIRSLARNIDAVLQLNEMKQDLESARVALDGALQQLDEKVDPLSEVSHPFSHLAIHNLHGKFYPSLNQKTGQTDYKFLDIPEFSAEKGQLVLLSGKSGVGKSTFIKLLKRGSIDNRNPLIIDEKETFDKLGNQFIAFKADSELSTTSNALKQVVGKENFSDLTSSEQERAKTILERLNFPSTNFIKELSSKNYSQFSTGQQKRLVFAHALYRAGSKPSILLVDEPAGNVEDSLVEEQFKMIRDYTKNSKIITLLVTHRTDLAKKYVDKEYHIDNNGLMKEVNLQEQER